MLLVIERLRKYIRDLRLRIRAERYDYEPPIDRAFLDKQPPDHPRWQECMQRILDARQLVVQSGRVPKFLYLPDDIWEACETKIELINTPNKEARRVDLKLFGMIVRRGEPFRVE